ncbi:MAG: YkvA family protein [Burkholderiaceae bacterium]
MKRFALLATLFWKFRSHARFVWAMVRDKRTPVSAKLMVVGAALYLLSPIDVIPDVLVGIGWVDDLAVVSGLLALAYKFLPADLHAELRAKVNGAAPATGGAKMDKEDPRVVDMP